MEALIADFNIFFCRKVKLFSVPWSVTHTLFSISIRVTMSTQTALALTELGKPLTKISVPGPDTFELAANEILIKLTVAGRQLFSHA